MSYTDADFYYEPGSLPQVPAHSHTWIDPTEPPIERAPYSTAIGPHRREMKPGKHYVCRVCKLVLHIPVE